MRQRLQHTNLTGWSKAGGRWTVADGVYRQTRTTSNATSRYQAEFSAHSASARIKLESPSRAASFVSFNIATQSATKAYRLVLQAGSIAQLQYLHNGTVSVLASQALLVVAGWPQRDAEVPHHAGLTRR